MDTGIYHYVMTIQSPQYHGLKVSTSSGVIPFNGTRSEAFHHIFEEVCRRGNIEFNGANVIFWSFEPNEL